MISPPAPTSARYFNFEADVHGDVSDMYDSMASRIMRIATRLRSDEL